jgi:hypothetical protein
VGSIESDHSTTTTISFSKSFKEADQTIPYRFVGSYEYYNALESFTKLLNISTTEEIPVYDLILNDRPEFTYFNGVNTAFPSKPDLKKADPFQRKKYYDTFQKKGLAAMMALARIELAATMSMYGSDEKPFESIFNGNFGLEQYVAVLSDDVVAHMKSLAQEPKFMAVTRRGNKIDTWTLAYLRRLKLIRDMLGTLSDVGDETAKARIRPYDKKLGKYERRLVNHIADQTGTKTLSSSTETETRRRKYKSLTVSRNLISNCNDLVRGTTTSTGPPRKKKMSAGDAVLAR